jgi:hypothetical protein
VDDVGLREDGVQEAKPKGVPRGLPHESGTTMIPPVPVYNRSEVGVHLGACRALSGVVILRLGKGSVPDGMALVGLEGRGEAQ